MFLAEITYSTKEAAKLSGLSESSLRYYDKNNIFPPSIAGPSAKNKHIRRKYSTVDILVLQAVAELKRRGMHFTKIRNVIEYLRDNKNLKKPFHSVFDGRHNVRILTDSSDDFYLCYNDHEVVEHLKAGGQYMLLDVSDMAIDLKDKVRALQYYKRKKEDKRFSKKPLKKQIS